MSWSNKVKIDDIILFCDEWKTRSQIREKFNLTNIESWHLVKWCSKLSDIMKKKGQGATARTILYKSRQQAIQKIKEKNK